MAKKLNQTRYTRAKLVVANIDSYGKHYAFEYGGADGLSIINVDPIPAPTDIKTYLEGSLTISSFPVSSNITKLCAYALASFPNLESVYLFKNDDLVELEQDCFFGLDNLDGIYVPDTLFDSYVATYPQYEDLFKKIITTMDLVVPTFEGVTKLTKQIFSDLVGMLESAKKNAIERVVVPAQYTELETECFEAISQLQICDTIVLEGITSAEADFMKGISSISYIELQNSNFTLQGVADSTGTANFKWLVPIAYMHDYIYQQYVKDYYVTGYAGITSGQAMPSREEYGYWKWYSSPTTTDDTYLGDSETYPIATYTGKAYAFLIIDTLILTGTGTLTSALVEQAINSIDTEISPLEYITKIIVKPTYTGIENGALNVVDDYLENVKVLETNQTHTSNIYHWDSFDRPIQTLIYKATARSSLTNVYITNLITYQKDFLYTVGTTYVKNLTFMEESNITWEYGTIVTTSHIDNTIIRNLTTIKTGMLFNGRASGTQPQIQNGYYPKATNIQSYPWGSTWYCKSPTKHFIGTTNCVLGGKLGNTNATGVYVPATAMSYYKTASQWSTNYASVLRGVIDGNNVYVDKGFNYPKLSATLTLDTINGHLMDNGTDLFAGYIATWYSDEDCTQVIQPANITADMTVYVKLAVDPNYFSEVTVQGKSTPSSSGETVITKGFTSGGEHFTQLYIYEDGEIWYINGSGSVQAYANGVWEIEYKTLQFDSGVELTDAERIALLNNYDKI